MFSKIKMKTFLIIFTLIISTYGSLIDNFLKGAKSLWPKISDLTSDTQLKKLPQIEFELPGQDDEFIKQGLDTINAPTGSLDVCTHKVILQLKKNCNQMTLEEIGKLAIMFLNCQLMIENRPKLPCKPEMTLQQCTMGMDNNMYQIYNIMNHRTVSVCQALKHDNFRALTEMTVNRLMQVTQSQMTAISEALINQRRINEMGLQNIREFEEHQEKIKDEQLKTIKELIKASEIIEDINSGMKREVEWKKKSEDQMIEIDKTTSQIAEHLEQTNRQMIAHYQEALDFLENFKTMMDLVATFSNNIQQTFEKFKGISHEIGIDITAEFFVLLTVDVCYFVILMIFIIFMGLSSTYKNILIGLTTFNALAGYYKSDVSIAGTNVLVWLFYIIFYRLVPVVKTKLFNIPAFLTSFGSFNILNYIKLNGKVSNDQEENERERSITPQMRKQQEKEIFKSPRKTTTDKDDEDKEMEEIYSNQLLQTPSKFVSQRAETPNNFPKIIPRAMSPALARVKSDLNAERAATPFLNQPERIQCKGITTKGAQCRNAAQPGYEKCRMHNYN